MQQYGRKVNYGSSGFVIEIIIILLLPECDRDYLDTQQNLKLILI